MFLWLLHHNAVYKQYYDLKDLIRLNDRVAAHLDGIKVADEYSEVCAKRR